MKSCFSISKRGSRENNEDFVGLFEKGADICVIVADGLGGHGKGEVASEVAVETGRTLFEKEGWNEFFFQKYFELCEEALENRQREERAYNDIKTTVVLAGIKEDKLNCAHVGDSRLYFFRHKKLMYRTLDHSVPQMLVFAKEIKEKEIRNHPDRNRLLKVMGQKTESVFYEVTQEITTKEGDAILMCTDGFWELIEEKAMCKILKKAKDAEDWLLLMEEIVLNNGNGKEMDNYSAVAIII